MALAGAHAVDRFALELHHRWRRERRVRRAWFVLARRRTRLASTRRSTSALMSSTCASPERTLQRVAQDGALFDDRLTLQVAIARERDGLPRDIRRLTFVLRVMRALACSTASRPATAGSQTARRSPGVAAASPRARHRAWRRASGAPRSARRRRPVDPLRPGTPQSAAGEGWRRRGTRACSRAISG